MKNKFLIGIKHLFVRNFLLLLNIPLCFAIWFDFAFQSIAFFLFLLSNIISIIIVNKDTRKSILYSIYPLIILVIYFIYDFILNYNNFNIENYGNFWQVFIILSLGLTPTIHLKNKNLMILIFYFSTLIYILFVLVSIFLIKDKGFSLRSTYNTLESFEVHISYLGFWFSLASYLFSQIVGVRYYRFIILVLPVVFLYLLEIRTLFFCILFYYCIIFIFYLKLRVRVLFIFFIGALFTCILFTGSQRFRIYELINFENPSPNDLKSIDLRYGIYKCSYDLIKKRPIVGFGQSRVQSELNFCYQSSYTTDLFQRRKFDSHNLLIHFFISFGIIGLLLFCIIIIHFTLKLQLKDIIFLIVVFGGFGLTENYIFRLHGIILTLFWVITIRSKKSKYYV